MPCWCNTGELKLGDFGLARIFGSPDRKWTNQVCFLPARPARAVPCQLVAVHHLAAVLGYQAVLTLNVLFSHAHQDHIIQLHVIISKISTLVDYVAGCAAGVCHLVPTARAVFW